MADGFLGRWSRRKLEVKEGKAVEPEPPVAVPEQVTRSVIPAQAGTPGALDARQRGNDEVVQPPPGPTLEDARALTPESDFSLYTGRNVQPEVSNAAMKKLFADPHYNIMDGLDIYIDDYSKPDPIPPAMLRQLASAKFLGLFDDEEAQEKDTEAGKPAAAQGGDDAHTAAGMDVAQSGLCNELPSQPDDLAAPASRPDHDDPDLRLQQDHAPPGETPGSGAR